MMSKYEIEHTNTDVRKLWNLARNGAFSISTVKNIFKNGVSDGKIKFNSKYAFDKYTELQFSSLAAEKH